jgi:hypothetical protein
MIVMLRRSHCSRWFLCAAGLWVVACANPPAPSFEDILERAQAGRSSAQVEAAYIYMTGRGAGQNRVQAMRWYRAAALQGNEDAIAALAQLGQPVAGPSSYTRVKLPVSASDQAGRQLNLGRYHALVVGNAAYRELPPLETTANDAFAVSELLRVEYGFEVTTLIDATWAAMRNAMSSYRRALENGDNLLIYFAGHGWVDPKTDEAYWMPVDAEEENDTYWISNATIATTLKGVEAQHVMVVADSCFSGTLVRGISLQPKASVFVEKLHSSRSRTAMTSGGIEPVTDSGENGHSVFANAFLSALGSNQGVLDATSLYAQIRRGVVTAADQTPSYGVIRKSGHVGGDFLFNRLESDKAK